MESLTQCTNTCLPGDKGSKSSTMLSVVQWGLKVVVITVGVIVSMYACIHIFICTREGMCQGFKQLEKRLETPSGLRCKLSDNLVLDTLLKYDFTERKSLHDPSSSFHGIRNSKFTWEQVSHDLELTGQKFCSLYRDNWSCTGDRWRSVLNVTRPYDPKKTLSFIPRGSHVFVEGNSFLAQLVVTFICESFDNRTMVLWDRMDRSNTVFIWDKVEDRRILLVDNDPAINMNRTLSQHLIKYLVPNVHAIFVGPFNVGSSWQNDGSKLSSIAHRSKVWAFEFPRSKVIQLPGEQFVGFCFADFRQCSNRTGHNCLPGPMLRSAEAFYNCIHAILLERDEMVTACQKNKMVQQLSLEQYMYLAG